MRYLALTSFVVIAAALAAGDAFGAGPASGSRVPGIPSTGSQSGFGRSGINGPASAGTPSSGTTGSVGGPTGTGTSSFSTGPSNAGTIGTPSGSGLPSGIGGGTGENNGYPMTTTQGGGLTDNSTAGSSVANGSQSGANQVNIPKQEAYRQIGYFQGRWWYAMGDRQWVYWDSAASSWVFYRDTAGELAKSDEPSGQHSSGYRGLNNANENSTASSSSKTNGWFFRDGQWFWFKREKFPASPVKSIPIGIHLHFAAEFDEPASISRTVNKLPC